MLKLILGRAKSGKTGLIMREIRDCVNNRRSGIVLLVPEQYSHEAEVELLSVCGDSLSRYAEVLSFTRMAHSAATENGGGQRRFLNRGGRCLCMALALDAVGSRLKIYSSARRQNALQDSLLSAIDELKSALVSPQALDELARDRGDSLGEKLRDLSLVYSAYEAICAQTALDPMDTLTLLAQDIPHSRFAGGRVYVDGFTDFTAQQTAVLKSLLLSGAELTVCLSCPGLEEDHDIFEPSRRAAAKLLSIAQNNGIDSSISIMKKNAPASALEHLEAQLFSFDSPELDAGGHIRLALAPSVTAECEAAAARCISLVRSGCRWRDIAIAVRGYDGYRGTLESIFSHYGVPLYSARKSDIFEKPVPSMLQAAFAVISGGWSYEDMFTYLKSGLAGLSREETDVLENYVFLWSIKGSSWTSGEDWRLHPDGYNGKFDEDAFARLEHINSLRRRASAPLALLQELGRQGHTAREHCSALSAFFERLELADTLSQRAEELMQLGMAQQAAESAQLWETVVSATEQCAAILGDTEMDIDSFGRLFCLVLSKYDLGSIPMSLDKVSAGDMDRMRRRSIKHLIVLGCDSSRVPSTGDGGGIFSDNDRQALMRAGIELGSDAPDRLYREFSLVYNCMTLPSESLYVSYCLLDSEGGSSSPSFVFNRLSAMFSLEPENIDIFACRASAPAPAFELAAMAQSGSSLPICQAAGEYFSSHGHAAELDALHNAARLRRGRLSEKNVRSLYGERLRLSASRIDKLASCPFSYFMQYGLKAKPRRAAEFSPPEMGTFMHYVLENVASEVAACGGFSLVDSEQLAALCDKYVEAYIHEKLDDMRARSPRFVYLFRRLGSSVRAVVADMAAELAKSDFKPLDFELDFSSASSLPPVELGQGRQGLILTGVADRVDGWLHDGKLYIRVVDYKTGIKKFSLSDVWYGMGLQMLLYLFALNRAGRSRYGNEIVPAGVMYVPARDVLISAKAEMSPQDIVSEKLRARRRSGLVLDNAEVLGAMERGDQTMYIPVNLKNGEYSGDALASAERFGMLSRHIDSLLHSLAEELNSGCIDAAPFYRSPTENACRFCDFAPACHFGSCGDKAKYLARMSPEEVWARIEEEAGKK